MPQFPGFLGKLMCEQQDPSTVCEVATQHWHPHEPREGAEQVTVAEFIRTGDGLFCRVRQLNAETSEILS